MKGAVVCANGIMKNYRYGFDNFVKNFIEYNDLDVYLFLQHNTATKIRGSDELDIHDEEVYLREKLGDRLKILYWTDEHSEFEDFRKPLSDLHKNRIKYLTEIYKNISPDPYLGSNDYVADQYIRLAHAGLKFGEYCQEYELKYDYVIRFRVDITIPIPFPCKDLRPLQNREFYAVDNGGFSIRDAFFMTTQDDFLIIAQNFIYDYGMYKPPLQKLQYSWLAPECQLAQFLLSLDYNVYNLKLVAEQSPKLDVNTLSWYPMSDFLEPLQKVALIRLSDILKEHDLDVVITPTPSVVIVPSTTDVYMILMIVFIVLFVFTNIVWIMKFYWIRGSPIISLPNERFL